MTAKQRQILTKMKDGEELVYEKGAGGYVKYTRVSFSTLLGLQRLMAISATLGSEVGKVERYVINETGRKLLCPSL